MRFRSTILPAAMVAALAVGLTETAFAETGGEDSSKEIAAVLSAKTSIAQAVATAERQTGGRAVKIDLREENGTYLYKVRTLSKDKAAKVLIDPMSGNVVRTDDKGPIAKDSDERDDLAMLSASPITLASAIALAEQHVGGKATEAGFDDEDGMPRFEVEVAKADTVHSVLIDSSTGKVVEDNVSEDDEHGEN